MTFYLFGFFPKPQTHNPSLTMKKKISQPKLRDILQITWPVLLKIAKRSTKTWKTIIAKKNLSERDD